MNGAPPSLTGHRVINDPPMTTTPDSNLMSLNQKHALNDWLIPNWSAPSNTRAVCTTRSGGVSLAPYDSMNLGDHVADDPECVAQNRQRLMHALQAHPVFLQQIHGCEVLQLSAQTPDAMPFDACITIERGVVCTIMVADCLPVLLTDKKGRMVAAAHAGWRGLAGDLATGCGVLENTVTRMLTIQHADLAPTLPSELQAWLGPCIGPRAFEVGAEVREALTHRDAQAMAYFKANGQGKYHADLAGLARLRLHRLGVHQIQGNDSSAEWCTVGNASKYFSHRRDRVSGRFAVCIWLA